MIGLLLITHHTLGNAYRALAEHFFDRLPEHVHIQEVPKDEAPEITQEKTAHLLTQFSAEHGILILTDIFGATPCNIAKKLLQKERVIMITGINLPMMVKALQSSARAENVYAFAQELQKTACDGIMVLSGDEELRS